MKKLAALSHIIVIIAYLGVVSNAWAASLAPRLVAPARAYSASARAGLSGFARGYAETPGRQAVTRFYHSPLLRNQVERSLLASPQRFTVLPLSASSSLPFAHDVSRRFYAQQIQHDKVYKKRFTPIETIRTSQAAIDQSKKDIDAHRKIIADLETKIKNAQHKNEGMQAAIVTYTTALNQLLEKLEQTGGTGTVFMHRLRNPKIVSLQKLIKRLEELIKHEEHHIKSLQATLDHQKKLKADAAQVPQHEATRNAAIMQSTQQRLLKGNDIIALAADAHEAAELKQRLQNASIKDKELLAYHFITKDNISTLAQTEHGSELLQALVQSANIFALDARVIRETIAVQTLDDANIVAIANNPHGLAFLTSLIREHIGKDKISELLVDDITRNNVDEIANNQYGLEFLKELWDTENAYVKDHIKGLNKLQLLKTLQKPRTRATKSFGARIADYFASWGLPATTERVQQ